MNHLAKLRLAQTYTMFAMDENLCQSCNRRVETADYELFEKMHYVCFHYEFEHGELDIDSECSAGGCPSRNTDLDVVLREWEDWDVAGFSLGRAIGLFENWHEAKHTFWTNNARGDGLLAALGALSEAGILERRDEPDIQFRWASDEEHSTSTEDRG